MTRKQLPARLSVYTDDPTRAQCILLPLVDAGLARVESFEALPREPVGFRLAVERPHWRGRRLRTALETAIERSGFVSPIYRLHLSTLDAVEDKSDLRRPMRASLMLPLVGAATHERMHSILAARGEVTVRLLAVAAEQWGDLSARLAALGYVVESAVVERAPTRITLQHGGLPGELVDEIRAHVQIDVPHVACEPRFSLPLDNREVVITLAPRLGLEGSWPARARLPRGRRTFLEMGDSRVRIGRVVLPFRGRGFPTRSLAERLRSLCFDASTAATAEFLAESIQLAEPALLTGSSGCGKSEIATLLAELTGRSLVRVGFGPDLDADSLLGRFQPNAGETRLAPQLRRWREQIELLDPRSVVILERASAEERALTELEVHAIHGFEHVRVAAFAWSDGPVLRAVHEGSLLVLDELNLAPTEAIERLNPLLESPPSLLLGEKSGEQFGGGGEAIHPDFRIVATRNPGSYGGRQALSPALLSRFTAQRVVPDPNERDYEQMLRRLVFGEQPEIEVDGVRYEGWATDSDPRLAPLRRESGLIRAVARFHAGIEAATANESRQEREAVVTRRTLRMVMVHIATALAAGERNIGRATQRALKRYYLEPIALAMRASRIELMQACDLVAPGVEESA